MHILIPLLLLAAGEAAHWQKLKCPYEQNQEMLPRVWCLQSSAQCCSGLTFSPDAPSADGGRLKVTEEDPQSFTVELLESSHREGVYWCGVLGRNNTVIKLAEGYFYCSTGSYIWAHLRWILLVLLPTVTTSTCIYSRRITRHHPQKAEHLYDDIIVPGPRTDPRYENAASSLLQEG